MKQLKLFTFLFAVLLLTSCGGNAEAEGDTTTGNDETTQKEIDPKSAKAQFASTGIKEIGPEKTEIQQTVDDIHARIAKSDNPYVGYWVGSFGKNMINIILSDVEDGVASGYSVCAGNYRALKGTAKKKGENAYSFILNEPGDDQYDGRFEFVIDLNDKNLDGTWIPFNGKKAKSYTLNNRDFVYDIKNGDYSFASEVVLKDNNLMEYQEDELRMIRSEIYARHGYSFKEKDIRYHFESKDWYMPMSTDVREKLTEIEEGNIGLLYEYETYYEEYYNEYGR
jgi:hypothetical protein